jgi:DNA topoisomerase-1
VLQVDNEGKPVQTVKVEVKCEKCGKPMALRQGRRGPFLGCTGYPKCRGTAPIPDDLKEQLAELAPAPAASHSPDLKAIEVPETCDECGSPMVVRRGRRGFFLGCSKYPKCKGTKEPSEGTLEKINAVVAG